MRAAVATAGPGDLNKVESESRSIFGRLLAVAENYPELKTNTTVMSLMDSVKGLEDEYRPPAIHLQQCLAGIQHPDGHHPIEIHRRYDGSRQTRGPCSSRKRSRRHQRSSSKKAPAVQRNTITDNLVAGSLVSTVDRSSGQGLSSFFDRPCSSDS